MKLAHTLISVSTFSRTVSARETQSARETDVFEAPIWKICSDELLADQLPTQFQ